MFHDLDPNFVVDDEMVYLDKVLGKGAFGKVYAGELRRVCKLEIKKKLNIKMPRTLKQIDLIKKYWENLYKLKSSRLFFSIKMPKY